MICVIAFFVFLILGIFSVKYRKLAKESFGCVTKRLTFKPCDSALDKKIRANIVAHIFKRHKGLAGFVNKRFEILSWILLVLMIVSSIYLALGAYNLVLYGTCDPQHPENCPITVIQGGKEVCDINAAFVEFYGAECPHCKKMIPIVEQVEKETGYVFDKKEIWHDEKNQQIMSLHAEDITRDCGLLGVPAFYSMNTKKAKCGEMSAEALKQFVLENK
ncbi:MAG: hypothetical protein COT15_05130 [Candidatus Diapherotrites archaeon CG08_land_8_20_14_0_20_34_12]|nr:MAG: hypothetical protein COT15_05130 [Candidatus Diapherotrites archaeon CG08_land_8_20_14_0_20_34_12]